MLPNITTNLASVFRDLEQSSGGDREPRNLYRMGCVLAMRSSSISTPAICTMLMPQQFQYMIRGHASDYRGAVGAFLLVDLGTGDTLAAGLVS